MQTPKSRKSSSEPPQKISPRPVRQLKINGVESDSASSSSQASRTPKDRSPKVTERRSPRTPVSELQKRRPSKVSELESQVSQLQDNLKNLKDQLCLSESSKKEARKDSEESKENLLAVSSKLEESQKQLLELSASEEARVAELQKISQERELAWKSELESIHKQHSVETAELATAMNEIEQLKVQLGKVEESEATQAKRVESSNAELKSLKENLAETLSIVEDMKNQLRVSKESESQAQVLISETLLQLETAKKTVETLKLDGTKSSDAYNAIASELDQSRTRVNYLEELVSKLNSDITSDDKKLEHELEAEVNSLKAEVVELRAALDTAESRYNEEQIRSTVQIRSAHELAEKIKSESSLREAELDKMKADIEELKANLMDKETELQGISEENEGLNMKLNKSLSFQRENELERELKISKEKVEDLKGNLMDKETEFQNIVEENEVLKMEIKRREMERGKVNDEVVSEVEAARKAEREALVKLGYVTEEAVKSKMRAARVAEHLEALQAANSDMEAELRRLKVQSDQWRKAAEAAASMLSGGHNGNFMERTGSLDNNYNPKIGNIGSPYADDEDDLMKKKNGNMLKKIGVLWKKQQK